MVFSYDIFSLLVISKPTLIYNWNPTHQSLSSSPQTPSPPLSHPAPHGAWSPGRRTLSGRAILNPYPRLHHILVNRFLLVLSVAEMRMLRWCCGHTRGDRVRNDDIRDRVGVAPIEEKLIQHRLRWFGHVQRRPPEAPVRSGVLKRANNVKSSRGRPKLTWDESVKRDLKEWNISNDLAMDRSAWRLAINVPEPWPLFVLCPLCPFMCLPVSRLFWVSSLAYPNLLGTKGYVVVVVV
jgi:hypothetical protein